MAARTLKFHWNPETSPIQRWRIVGGRYVGKRVVVKGHRHTSRRPRTIKQAYTDIEGGVRLDAEFEGHVSWNLEDLRLLNGHKLNWKRARPWSRDEAQGYYDPRVIGKLVQV